MVGGTGLFRTAEFPAGAALFERLGAAGIYVRRFAGAPGRLRFGLPADKTEWWKLTGKARQTESGRPASQARARKPRRRARQSRAEEQRRQT